MSAVGIYKLKPPSFQAATYDEVYDALQTIKEMIGATSTKIDSVTSTAEFTIEGVPSASILSVALGNVVVKGEGTPYVMTQEEFNETFETY